MSEPGEIRRLADIAAPSIGVITNVAPCHLEQLGSLEAVAAAKGELLDALGPDDCAVVNADDERVRALGTTTACPGDYLRAVSGRCACRTYSNQRRGRVCI